jgi:hypothetical protein
MSRRPTPADGRCQWRLFEAAGKSNAVGSTFSDINAPRVLLPRTSRRLSESIVLKRNYLAVDLTVSSLYA